MTKKTVRWLTLASALLSLSLIASIYGLRDNPKHGFVQSSELALTTPGSKIPVVEQPGTLYFCRNSHFVASYSLDKGSAHFPATEASVDDSCLYLFACPGHILDQNSGKLYFKVPSETDSEQGTMVFAIGAYLYSADHLNVVRSPSGDVLEDDCAFNSSKS